MRKLLFQVLIVASLFSCNDPKDEPVTKSNSDDGVNETVPLEKAVEVPKNKDQSKDETKDEAKKEEPAVTEKKELPPQVKKPLTEVQELSQYGVTWLFKNKVKVGKFVNGDYYVVDDGNVIVTKITPESSSGRHGSMVNPQVETQAYDDRIKSYDATKDAILPLKLKGGDSLVSSISLLDEEKDEKNRYANSWNTVKTTHARLKAASVLTVLSEQPVEGTFRPPYVHTDRPLYNISQINKSYLPGLDVQEGVDTNIATLERGVQRPWLVHLYDWTARAMHPIENMPSYHREIGVMLSDVMMVLVSNKKTDPLLYGFFQTGIDQYHSIINGKASSANFEFHTIYTGLLLGNNQMANVWVEGKSQTIGRATEKFYFAADKKSLIPSAIVPEGKTWTGATVFFRKQVGNSEHEHLHPSEWDLVENTGGGKKNEGYRQCCDSIPHLGMALTSQLVGADKYWPNQALKKYLKRWMEEPFESLTVKEGIEIKGIKTQSMGSDFNNMMWQLHGK
jgi:hypothetical protein